MKTNTIINLIKTHYDVDRKDIEFIEKSNITYGDKAYNNHTNSYYYETFRNKKVVVKIAGHDDLTSIETSTYRDCYNDIAKQIKQSNEYDLITDLLKRACKRYKIHYQKLFSFLKDDITLNNIRNFCDKHGKDDLYNDIYIWFERYEALKSICEYSGYDTKNIDYRIIKEPLEYSYLLRNKKSKRLYDIFIVQEMVCNKNENDLTALLKSYSINNILKYLQNEELLDIIETPFYVEDFDYKKEGYIISIFFHKRDEDNLKIYTNSFCILREINID